MLDLDAPSDRDVLLFDQEEIDLWIRKLNGDDLARDFCYAICEHKTTTIDEFFTCSIGQSMLPTIASGSHGFGIPLNLVSVHSIKKGDVVGLITLDKPWTPKDLTFVDHCVMRVVALLGDTVEFEGRLYTCPPGH